MLIATVLRSGGDYTPEHVQWLHRQLPQDVPSVCFSDIDIPGVKTIPLRHNWPGWWAKLELFRPDIHDDIFFLDLDTVITGDISTLLAEKRLMMLNDFYHPEFAASGVMRIPHEVKHEVWHRFTFNPERHMRIHRIAGDQGFLSRTLTPARWQDNYPDQFISYKAHVAACWMPGFTETRSAGDGTLPPDARIVCFHGFPRPWEVQLDWIPAYATENAKSLPQAGMSQHDNRPKWLLRRASRRGLAAI